MPGVRLGKKKFEAFPKKAIDPEDVYQTNELGEKKPVDLVCNQFVILRADQSSKKTQLGRFDGKKIVPLAYKKKKPYGISPRNVGQYFLQEALMTGAEEAPLVIVKGMAGTAKTFYSPGSGTPRPAGNRDAGLPPHPHQPAQRPLRRRHRLSPRGRGGEDRPPPPAGDRQPGTPGRTRTRDERFADERSLSGKIEELFARDLDQRPGAELHPGPVGDQTYLIIDEAQNLTPKQAKGIITRGGDGHQDHPPGGPQPRSTTPSWTSAPTA